MIVCFFYRHPYISVKRFIFCDSTCYFFFSGWANISIFTLYNESQFTFLCVLTYVLSPQNASSLSQDHVSEFTPLASMQSPNYQSNEFNSAAASRSNYFSKKVMLTHWQGNDYFHLPSLFGYSNTRYSSSTGSYLSRSGLETSVWQITTAGLYKLFYFTL